MPKDILLPIALKTFDVSGLSGGFDAIDPQGLEEACVFIRITNNSDADLEISYNGDTAHDFVAANSTIRVDAQQYRQPHSYRCLLREDTIVYIRGTAGTGTCYVAGYYQPRS